MKIKCKRDVLYQGFQQIQNIASARTTLPILGNVLLEAKGNTVDITATDLEIGIKTCLSCTVEEEGVTTLPAKKIFSLLRELPDSEVMIEVGENHVTKIQNATSVFKIIGLPHDDFPKLPQFEKKKGWKLEQSVLKEMIRKTSYAVSRDETRYVLSGLYFLFNLKKIQLVATDGRRLAYVEKDIQIDGSNGEMILPIKAVNEISKILKDEGTLDIILLENQVAFRLNDCVIISRLIEGHFPNYKQVIPEKMKEKIVIDREQLLSAVRRVAVVTNEKSNSVKFTFMKGILQLTANAPEVGEAKEEMAVPYSGEECAIAFNPAFLIDVLKNLDEPEVNFEFNDKLSPGVISTGTTFLSVIMPMKTV